MTVTVKQGGIENYLHVGQAAAIQFEPEGGPNSRLPTIVRGWETRSLLILDRPKVQERWAPMRDGDTCIIRLVNEGSAIAFESELLSYDNLGKSCRCHVAWPLEYHLASFRQHERVEATLRGTLSAKGVEPVDINVTDMSMSGCGLTAPVELAIGTAVLLSFVLPDGTSICNAKATVRGGRPTQDGWSSFGCEFEQGQAYLASEVAYFITTSLGRATERRGASVLIIDAEGTVSDPLWESLHEKGCDAHIVRYTLDGLVRLRSLKPPVLVVHRDQPDLSGVEIARLVRNTPGLEETNIFLFGGGSEADAREADVDGLAAHFSTADGIEKVRDAVLAALKAELDAK